MCHWLNSSGMSKKHAFRNQKVSELLVCPEPFHLKHCEQKGSSSHWGKILTQFKQSNDRHYYHEGCGKVILFLYDFILKPPEYPDSKINCPLCCSFFSMFLSLTFLLWSVLVFSCSASHTLNFISAVFISSKTHFLQKQGQKFIIWPVTAVVTRILVFLFSFFLLFFPPSGTLYQSLNYQLDRQVGR